MHKVQQILDKVKGDKVIWAIVLLFSLISLLAVYSATGSLAYRSQKDATHFLWKQLMVSGVGLLIIYFVHRVNYTKFAKWAYILFYLSLPLLIYTLFFGTTLNEGSRWIKLPVVNITFQTSDLAKLALFLYLARMLSLKQEVIKDFKKGFLSVLWPVAAVCTLIAPANLSTALMLFVTCSLLFIVGRVSMKHIAILAAAGILLVGVIYGTSKALGIGRAETWEKRIMDFAGSGENKEPVYQVLQAKVAIANGGLFGRGPGNSLQRNFVPHPYSDFIYSIIIEEYGLFGGAVILFLYLLFLWRCILLFRRCPYAFGAFLAVGLSMTLVFQAMLNMAVNVNLLPVTGLTLPLISMGGSSIWFTSIAIGVVLSVSRYVDEMEGKKKVKKENLVEEPVLATA